MVEYKDDWWSIYTYRKKSIIGELYVSKEAFPSIKIPMKPIILDGTASYGF